MAQANRRSGNNPLAYLGVEPISPTNFVIQQRDPTVNDYFNFNEGDEWLNQVSEGVWKLVNKDAQVATWVQITGGSSSPLTFHTDGADANPSGGAITMAGGSNITTSGSGATVTYNLDANITLTSVTTTDLTVTNAPTFSALGQGVVQSNSSGVIFSSEGSDGQVLISSSVGAPIWHTVTAGSGISVTNGHNTITIASSAAVADSFPTDSGTAVPAAGALTIHGGTGITTSGSGSTVTISLSSTPPTAIETITGNTGGAISPSANNINIVTAHATPVFAGSGSTETLDFNLSNLVLGSALPSLAGGLTNVGIGSSALNALTTGSSNATLGYQAGSTITTGSNNILVGKSAGSSYTSSESSNIILGNSGAITESNVIRIGTQGSGAGQQNKAFMAGVYNVAVGATQDVVVVDNNGQLGGNSFSALSWTPTLSFGGSSTGITYAVQEGIYQSVGNIVFYAGGLVLTSKGAQTGVARIGGLPFASSGVFTVQFGQFACTDVTFPASYTFVWQLNEIGTTNLIPQAGGSGLTQVNLDNTAFHNNSQISVTGYYFRS